MFLSLKTYTNNIIIFVINWMARQYVVFRVVSEQLEKAYVKGCQKSCVVVEFYTNINSVFSSCFIVACWHISSISEYFLFLEAVPIEKELRKSEMRSKNAQKICQFICVKIKASGYKQCFLPQFDNLISLYFVSNFTY